MNMISLLLITIPFLFTLPHCSSYNFKKIRSDEKNQNISSLANCLQYQTNPYLRTQCAQSLGRIYQEYPNQTSNPKSVNLSIKALSNSLSDPSWTVRLYSAQALSKIGNPSSIPSLQKQLSIETDEEVSQIIQKSINTLKSNF